MQLQCNKMKITRVGCVTDVTDQYPLGDREFRRSFVIIHEQDMSWEAVAEKCFIVTCTNNIGVRILSNVIYFSY